MRGLLRSWTSNMLRFRLERLSELKNSSRTKIESRKLVQMVFCQKTEVVA
jgi:hypothetical protein